MSAQRVEIDGVIVRRPVLPAAEQNPHPFEGQRAQRGMVGIASPPLLVVVPACPAREANGLVRVLVKRLLEELGTGQAVMDPAALPAPLGDRGDAGVGLELGRRVPAGAVGAEGGR